MAAAEPEPSTAREANRDGVDVDDGREVAGAPVGGAEVGRGGSDARDVGSTAGEAKEAMLGGASGGSTPGTSSSSTGSTTTGSAGSTDGADAAAAQDGGG
jgi:hypothetical protein